MRKHVALLAGLFALTSGLGNAFADDEHHPPCRDCQDPTRETCFNLVCHYEFEGEGTPRHCTASTIFNKAVTRDGGEVQDDSNLSNNPRLEVSCDDKVVFANSARRYTDLLGTRIQGQTGPTPAILLPRGTLHSGSEGSNGGHYSRSILEIDTGQHFLRGKGKCFIWTGPQ